LRVSVRPEGPGLSNLVSDTGPGIPLEEQAHIFTPFHQGDGLAVSPHRQGAGLDLAIVKSPTELLGGTVDVESEVGRGSTFTLRIPRALQEPFASDAPVRKTWVSPPP
jgi:signal transduction histidine kinase